MADRTIKLRKENRWLVLAVFSLAGFVNGMFWITFAPIRTLTIEIFELNSNNKSGGGQLVDAMSMSYLVLYVPGSLLSLWIFSKYNLRTGIVFCTLITALGGGLRYGSSVISLDSHARYGVLLAGQSLAALAQPFLTNTPAKVASRWFTPKHLDIATAIASLCNPLGIIAGTVLSSTSLRRNENQEIEGMDQLLLIQGLLSLVSFLAALVAFPNRPDILPSEAVRLQLTLLENQENYSGSFFDVVLRVWSQIKACLKESQFRLLLVAFSVGIGSYNALTTLVEELIKPLCPHSAEDDASLYTATVLVVGLLTTMVTATYLDRTKNYKGVLATGTISCFVSLSAIMISLWKQRSKAEVVLWFALYGATLTPLLPTAMQSAAEITYPVSEDISTMLLQAFGQSSGVFLIYGESLLLDNAADPNCSSSSKTSSSRIPPSGFLFILWASLGLLPAWLLEVKSKRGTIIPASMEDVANTSSVVDPLLLGEEERSIAS